MKVLVRLFAGAALFVSLPIAAQAPAAARWSVATGG